jgi:phenylalanyl-tRNA synthetase beta chain
MKISYNWLKAYCNVHLSPSEISEILTDCGLEVESAEKFQSVKGGLEGIVVGEVKTRRQHPNADRLSITTVDAGTGTDLQIICGASNVAEGQKVAVAMVGATLYPTDGASFQINKSKIRGEISEGMICAEDEIGLGTSHEGIMVLDSSAKPGTPASEYFKIENDTVFEIGLTPNRPDAASHIGVARDLVAALQHHKIPRSIPLEIPSTDAFKTDSPADAIQVSVEDTQACIRYSGVSISGVTVAPSPQWLQDRLLAIGLKPINNIVDITNFVLHECGQPLHAFDADRIKGRRIIVKKLPESTSFVTLDNVERKLSASDLMICDEAGGMCIAGVYGGISSGVTASTKNIFLESACFEPGTIRKTSRLHLLKTDAAFRFERGVDPNNTLWALKRAALLIKEIAGGSISSEVVDVYPGPVHPAKVELSYASVNRLAGNTLEPPVVKSILTLLGITIEKESPDGLSLRIPTFKVDVTREADVIEELLRIYGYNHIALSGRITASLNHKVHPDPDALRNTVSDYLSGNGFNEIMSLSLTKGRYAELLAEEGKEAVRILNPLSSDLDVLRQSLLFSGLEAISYNRNRRQSDLRLYEFGKIYYKTGESYGEEYRLSLFATGRKAGEQWNSPKASVDFFFLKGYAENVLRKLGITAGRYKISQESFSSPFFNEGLAYNVNGKRVIEIGALRKPLLSPLDITQEVVYADIRWEKLVRLLKAEPLQYREVSKFPEVRRDLSMLLDRGVLFSDIEKAAFQAERNLLRHVNLFDVYEGDKIESGKKSYAVSFTLVNEQETLTDKQIDKTMERIMQSLEKTLGAVIRK